MAAGSQTWVGGEQAAGADRDMAAVLSALRAVVTRHHYHTVHRVHCYELAPRWLDASLARTLGGAPPDTRDLLRLLYFRESLGAQRVDALLGPVLVAGLRRLGVLEQASNAATLASRYRLDVVGETFLLVHSPIASGADVYYGEDSQFLRSVLWPRAGDVCLDLCTGSGVQALRCAPLAARVDAVDLYPPAVRLAAMNVALNGFTDRVSVYEGDLWDALPSGAVYDYVVCNPPLIPVPDEVEYPLYGHGGLDGLQVVRRIVAELPARLAAGGRCTLIGACTGDEHTPAIRALVADTLESDLDVALFLLLRLPLRDWVRMIGETAERVCPRQRLGRTIVRWRAHYGAAFDRTWIYTYLVSGRRDAGAAGCRVFDYSAAGPNSFWFVNRGRVAH